MVDNFNRWTADYPGQRPQDDPNYMRLARQGIYPTINTSIPQPTPMAAPQTVTPPMPMAVPQTVTPPMIHADMIQIDDEKVVDKWEVANGTTMMFITRSEDKIIAKAVDQSGNVSKTVYQRKPPEPAAPKFDPADYVRIDEIESYVDKAILARLAKQKEQEAAE